MGVGVLQQCRVDFSKLAGRLSTRLNQLANVTASRRSTGYNWPYKSNFGRSGGVETVATAIVLKQVVIVIRK